MTARRSARGLASTLVGALAALTLVVAGAAPAQAAARVDLSQNPAVDGSTVVTVSGSGFQYLPNAPGGIYVFFGAVSDPATNSWAPSQGGRSGSTFSYSGESGSIMLVAFSGGSSASESNAVIDASGSWTAQMTIPGAVFGSSFGDPHSGAAQSGGQIDCLQVQCGIITIGAHGSVNANNESFTPVSFVTASGQLTSGTGAQSYTDEATVLDIPAASATPTAESAAEPTATAEAAAPVETSTETVATESSTTSVLVLGVLVVAALALVAAVIAVLVRRRRAAASGSDAPATTEPTTSAPTTADREDAR